MQRFVNSHGVEHPDPSLRIVVYWCETCLRVVPAREVEHPVDALPVHWPTGPMGLWSIHAHAVERIVQEIDWSHYKGERAR